MDFSIPSRSERKQEGSGENALFSFCKSLAALLDASRDAFSQSGDRRLSRRISAERLWWWSEMHSTRALSLYTFIAAESLEGTFKSSTLRECRLILLSQESYNV